MSQIVAIGLLVIAIILACYLVVALVDPERF